MKTKNLIFLSLMLFALILISNASAAEQCTQEECQKVCIFYFYSPDCHFCQQTKPFIDSIEANYPDSAIIHRYNVKEFDSYNLYNKFCTIQSIPMEQRGIPLVVIGSKFFMGPNQIKDNLEKELLDAIANNKTQCPMPEVCTNTEINQTNHQILANITKVTLPLITLAAAADSVNPCAIGVLIFLVGFLLLSSGGNRKRTLAISIIYIITVYLVYFLAGIGILAVLSKLAFLKILTKALAGVIILFGLMNIRDAFRQGKAMLAIPDGAKPLIHAWVYKASIPAAIILGIIVASVELPCTGGMYLAILALLASSAAQSTAFWYLAFYNLIFVLPLVIITLLFIFGLETEKMQIWLEYHKKKARLIIGIVLAIIGIILLVF
jgi:cytochrome c biogenesis protein CcdA/glutaredoxin